MQGLNENGEWENINEVWVIVSTFGAYYICFMLFFFISIKYELKILIILKKM